MSFPQKTSLKFTMQTFKEHTRPKLENKIITKVKPFTKRKTKVKPFTTAGKSMLKLVKL